MILIKLTKGMLMIMALQFTNDRKHNMGRNRKQENSKIAA